MEDKIKEIIEHIMENEVDIDDEVHIKKRARSETPCYWDSTWGIMLLDPLLLNPESHIAKRFRRRFRVSYSLFSEIILPLCKQHKILYTKKARIPLEFKILAALRMLGRDSCSDSIAGRYSDTPYVMQMFCKLCK